MAFAHSSSLKEEVVSVVITGLFHIYLPQGNREPFSLSGWDLCLGSQAVYLKHLSLDAFLWPLAS